MLDKLIQFIPLLVAILTLMVVYLERYDKFYLMFLRRNKLNFSGTWVGLSIFIPSPFQRITDEEHFFDLEVEIKHRGAFLKLTQKIAGISTFEGDKVQMASSRRFRGTGKLLRDQNLLIQFDEENGLTCGVMYLVSDTWGKQLEGIVTARSVEGEPALAKVILLPEAHQDRLEELRQTYSKKKAFLG